MWKVYKYAKTDIVDDEGCIIYKKDSWFYIGSYSTLSKVAEIVEHEIYLENCSNSNGNPKFKIESDFDE